MSDFHPNTLAIIEKIGDDFGDAAAFGASCAPAAFVALLEAEPTITYDEALDRPLDAPVTSVVIDGFDSVEFPTHQDTEFFASAYNRMFPEGLGASSAMSTEEARTLEKQQLALVDALPDVAAFKAAHFSPKAINATTWRELFNLAADYWESMPRGRYLPEGLRLKDGASAAIISWGT